MSDSQILSEQIAELKAEIRSLKYVVAEMTAHASKISEMLDSVTRGGDAVLTVPS